MWCAKLDSGEKKIVSQQVFCVVKSFFCQLKHAREKLLLKTKGKNKRHQAIQKYKRVRFVCLDVVFNFLKLLKTEGLKPKGKKKV